MRLHEAIETYLLDLSREGYSKLEIRRKTAILRGQLAYALGLHHPQIPRTLTELPEIRLEDCGTIGANLARRRREAAEHFLAVFRAHIRQGIRHLALATFVRDYQTEPLSGKPDVAMHRQAVKDLARTLGLEIELRTIDRLTYDRVIESLERLGPERAAGYSAAFFDYCHREGRLSFEPPRRVRTPYERVFDADFLGAGDGLWTGRLRLYLEYLKSEKNLSAAGIDYYARKLKLFVGWLDQGGTGEGVSTPILKGFLAEREKQGVKARTLAKYVYAVRYFFDFLLSRGLTQANPATHLRIKTDPVPEQPMLSELEVVRVIEHLEGQVFQNTAPQDVPQRIRLFRALRDLCLFLLFTLTGVRLSEACGMKLEEVDFTKRAVRIEAKGNRSHRKKHREILLPDALWSRLRRYLRTRTQAGAGWLWSSWSGQPMTAPGVNKIIVRRVQEAGVQKHISPHRLRATCASLYVKRGMDPFSLKTLLGHESVATTMDHYARLTEEELRAVWKRSNPLAGSDHD